MTRRSRSFDALRSAKAASIWLSIPFSAKPSLPISVSTQYLSRTLPRSQFIEPKNSATRALLGLR